MCELILNNQVLPIVLNAGCTDNFESIFTNEPIAACNTLLYVTHGRLTLLEESDEYKLSKGTLLFLDKGRRHHFFSDKYKNVCLYYIQFIINESGFYTDLAQPKLFRLQKKIEGITDSVLDEKIKDYAEYFHTNDRTPDLDINTRFYDILSECIKLNREYRPSTTSLSKEIISYLNEHINQPLNTKDMEKRFYLTYKYMGTAFKKETGSTILQYHTQLRIDSAQRLLSMTQFSIDEISRQLGYSDALYFSRVFKKQYGLSPQNYRKSHTSK